MLRTAIEHGREQRLAISETETEPVEALRVTEERLSLALDAGGGVGTWDWDVDRNLVYSDARFAELYSVDPAHAAKGAPVEDFIRCIHPDDVNEVAASIQKTVQQGGDFDSEYRIVKADGSIRFVLARGTCHLAKAGIGPRFYGVVVDVTERRNAQKVLQQRQLFIDKVVSTVPSIIYLYDMESDATNYLNAQAQIVLGYQESAVPGIFSLIHPDDVERFHVGLCNLDLLPDGITNEAQYRMSHANGSWRWMASSNIVFERTESKGASKFLCIARDITERHLADQELKRAKTRADLAAMAKSEFLAVMSHEIRTPMNGVIGMTSLLLETSLSPDQLECVRVIRSSGDLLLGIINDILDFSKIEAGRMDLERVPFDLYACIEGAVDLVSDKAREKNLTLRTILQPELRCRVLGDPGRIQQILLNYLSNAIKFTKCGEIQVRVFNTATEPMTTMFEVMDSGEGLREDQKANIFTAFVQGDASTTRRHGGTGLGLAICKKLVDLMDGELGVTSEYGKGSRFWFSLPFQRLEAGENSEVSVGQTPHEQNSSAGGQWNSGFNSKRTARILIAEDNTINQRLAQRIVEGLGYQADIVADGAEAVGAVQQVSYDLILMDCLMPEMDGFAATKAIRALEERLGYRTPIIALTANALVGDRERCLSAGMDDYLSKPMKKEQLCQLLERWIASSPAAEVGARTPHP